MTNQTDTKRDLKRTYKEKLRPMGVMQIKNLSNGKVFLDSSTNLEGLLNRHRFQLKMGVHHNKELQQDWVQLGADSFVIEALEVYEPKDNNLEKAKEDIDVLEELWLEKLAGQLYNKVK